MTPNWCKKATPQIIKKHYVNITKSILDLSSRWEDADTQVARLHHLFKTYRRSAMKKLLNIRAAIIEFLDSLQPQPYCLKPIRVRCLARKQYPTQ